MADEAWVEVPVQAVSYVTGPFPQKTNKETWRFSRLFAGFPSSSRVFGCTLAFNANAAWTLLPVTAAGRFIIGGRVALLTLHSPSDLPPVVL